MMNEIILLSLLAALFSLDTTAFGQFMISRPIVCAPLFGYLLGDIKTGLWIGMIVELMWVNVIAMGAAVPQDTTSIAILSTVWGLTAFPGHKGAMILALACAVPAGSLFKRLDILMRYFNVRIVHWVEEGVMAGKESRINQGVYLGLLLFFAKAFIFYLVLFYPGQWVVMNVYPLLSEKFVSGMELAWQLLPVAGMGLMIIAFNYDKFPYKIK